MLSRGTQNGKRVQSNMGAKNHATVMPDGMFSFQIEKCVVYVELLSVAQPTRITPSTP